jgi:hypothetical protein
MSEDNAATNEFLLREHQMLHAKMDLFTKEQFIMARAALAFTAIFWAYLAIAQPGWMPGFAYWTPTIVVVLLIIRTLSLLMVVRRMRAYLLSLESHMQLPDVLGWEKQRLRQKAGGVKALCILYWGIILGLNMGIAAIYIPMLRG